MKETPNPNTHYCLYETGGKVRMFGMCAKSQLQHQNFEDCLLLALGDKYDVPTYPTYVDSDKKIQPALDYSIDTIPVPAKVTIEGIMYTVTETPVIEFETTGEYQVFVEPENQQYMEKMFNVDNT